MTGEGPSRPPADAGQSTPSKDDVARAVVAAVEAASRGAHLVADPLDRALPPGALYPWPHPGRFLDEVSGREHEYLEAPDLEELAEELIAEHGDVAGDAGSFAIDFAWKAEGGAARGAPVLGKAVKLSGLAAWYGGAQFVIWLAADHAWSHQLTRRQVEALLFHQLMHVRADPESGRPYLAPHDAEVFRAELERYGAWREGLERTFGQLRLEGLG